MKVRAALCALVLAACATAPFAGRKTEYLTATSGSLSLRLEFLPQDAQAARQIAEVLPAAATHLKRWGEFSAPITIRVLPTHQALEDAVAHHGFPWLRAWARYDSIDLQSPNTWSEGGSPGQIGELLTHELTHCLMYQRAASVSDWARKELPLWFREGMASVTSDQGYRRLTNEELGDRLRQSPALDPLNDAEDLYQSDAKLVYGAAHRAFAYLVERFGEESVLTMLGALKSGRSFGAALQQAITLPEEAFTAQFLDYVRRQAWRPPAVR